MDKLEVWVASCSYCIHDQECSEIEGRQSGRGWGTMCEDSDVDPKFERAQEELEKLFPGSPETCPVNGWGCDECDYYMDCYPNWKEQG